VKCHAKPVGEACRLAIFLEGSIYGFRTFSLGCVKNIYGGPEKAKNAYRSRCFPQNPSKKFFSVRS
jgi:hypothetical protein